jgi:hypothetical protein
MGINVYPPASSGGLTKYTQLFTSSGTFTLPSGYGPSKPLLVKLIVVGGGGGGGGGGGNIYGYSYPGVGGGGGGSGTGFYFESFAVTANTTVTIGAGGNGGPGSAYGSGQPGTAGGSSYFGTIEAPGGGAGQGAEAWGGSYSYPSSTVSHVRYVGSMRPDGGGGSETVWINAGFVSNGGTQSGNNYGGLPGAGGSSGSPGSGQFQAYDQKFAGIHGGTYEGWDGGTYTGFPEYGSSNYHDYLVATTSLSQGTIDNVVSMSPYSNTYSWAGASQVSRLAGGRGRYLGKMWWIPGGGGGGQGGNNVIIYQAGSAGTRTSPGQRGVYGSLAGQSAAANTGGGGGGGCGTGAGLSGNSGGSGGSGYVLVEYYA